MLKKRFAVEPAFPLSVAALLGFSCLATRAHAQPVGNQPLHFQVSAATQRLEMIVNTTRILTLNHDVPRLLVQNPDIIRATPLSPNRIQVTALRPGVTALNVWDDNNQVQAIDVRVFGDVRALEETLKREFPDVTVQVRTLETSLLLTGHIPNSEDVARIVEIAREYFPKVINHTTVGGVQTVALHVKVMEVSRTKLRQLGIDWAKLTGDDFVIQSAAGLINAAATQAGTISGTGDSMRFGIISPGGTFGALIDVLKQNSLAKILAEPTLVTISGRPARFVVGGEIPIAVSGGLGVTTVVFREFGTIIDFVPIVKGNGRIHLEVRPHITEIDPSLRDPVTGTPGFRMRSVDTAVEMMSGQTLALAGLIQTRTESENKGIPWLSDLPWIGAAFRRVQESVNEVELLIMVTPEIVAPLDPHEVPPFGPGGFTTSPSDFDLFVKGYMEVPKCCLDRSCPQCRRGLSMIGPMGPERRFESLPPGQQTLPQSNLTLPPSARPRPRLNPSILEQTQNRTRFDGRHQFAYPQTYPSTAAPQTQYGTMRQNPYNWSTPTVPLSEKRNTPSEAVPTLVGPIGYDVLN